jgi:hypothetical protein
MPANLIQCRGRGAVEVGRNQETLIFEADLR